MRGIALTFTGLSIYEFLEKMTDISQAFVEHPRRTNIPAGKIDKHKHKGNVLDKGSEATKASLDLFCVFCRKKGHERSTCFRLKKKKQPDMSAEGTAAAVVPEPEVSANIVGLLDKCGKHCLSLRSPIVNIVTINNKPCRIRALFNTGSPISLIAPVVYSEYFSANTVLRKLSGLKYRAVNKTPIKFRGVITCDIALELLPTSSFNIDMCVLQETCAVADIVLGRDFFCANKLTVLSDFAKEADTVRLFSALIDQTAVEEIVGLVQSEFSEITTDFNVSIESQLMDTLREVQEANVESVENDHSVK